MEKALRYLILKMEKNFYENNRNLLCGQPSCMNREGLPCNCIPGLILNYAAHVISNCMNLETESVKGRFAYERRISCIRIKYLDRDVFPVWWEAKSRRNYVLESQICSKDHPADDQAYRPFGKYHGIDDIIDRIKEEEAGQQGRYIISEGSYVMEFWICFLGALRTREPEKTWKAILSMSVFFFPNTTLKYMERYLNDTDISKETRSVFICFIEQYLSFLSRMDPDAVTLYEFSAGFYIMSGVDVAEFLEVFVRTQRDKELLQYIRGYCIRNIVECRRRSNPMKQIVESLRKKVEPAERAAAIRIKSIEHMMGSMAEIKG